jgi:hypothetical protein
MKTRLDRRVVVVGLLLLAPLLTGCNEIEIESVWRDREISVDGDAADWRGLTTYVEKGNIAVGVANDAEDLFVCLHSPTREVAGQIVLRGLTVWLDPEGGSGKHLGIRCPIGTCDMPKPGGERMDSESMREMIVRLVDEAARRVELLGPDDLIYGTFPTGDIRGLEVALGYHDGRIVYELKLPLEKTEERPYAVEVDWGKKLGIGFVTPEVDMEAMRESMRESMGDRPPVGGSGRGGGRGGGGMRGGMPGGAPEPVELRCKAALALPAGQEHMSWN